MASHTVKAYDKDGLSKHYKWDSTGELQAPTVYGYKVDNGMVTLFGQVTQPVRKSDVERAVRRIPGVTAVNDQIEVLPLSRFDDQIRVRTLRTMLRSAPLDKYFRGVQPGIRIIVKNGDVTLDGYVLNNGDRQIAYMMANQVPGVFRVTNNLQLEPRVVR